MNITDIIRGLIGLVFVLTIALLFSVNRRNINWRLVTIGIILQFMLVIFMAKTLIGHNFLYLISNFFVWLFSFTTYGTQFVFGILGKGQSEPNSFGPIFAIQILPTIIFFASLMSIMYYLGIMQRIVQGMAWIMAKLMGTSGAESLDVSANTFIGMTEAPLVIRPYLSKLTHSELFTILVSGMAHIGGGVMVAYMQMLGLAYAKAQGWQISDGQILFAGHLLTASLIAGPATMVIAKIFIPETKKPLTTGTVRIKIERTHSNLIEAAASGASEGIKLVINIAGMLIAFIALIYLVNSALGYLGNILGINNFCTEHFNQTLSLELIFGVLFQSVAFIIGVPWTDSISVGSLMGIKLVLNEFVAYLKLSEMITSGSLSPKTIVIATYSLCGFANFASIAIQIGGISPLIEKRRGEIAKLGLKAVLGGTLATWMTASIAGMFIN